MSRASGSRTISRRQTNATPGDFTYEDLVAAESEFDAACQRAQQCADKLSGINQNLIERHTGTGGIMPNSSGHAVNIASRSVLLDANKHPVSFDTMFGGAKPAPKK